MPIEVTMPKLSDTMEEGKIIQWMKHVGDAVRPGDVLAEVETDKANMELEAYDEGVLSEYRVDDGQSAPVGAVIALLGAAGEARAAKPGAAARPTADKAAAKDAPPPAARASERRTVDPGELPEAATEQVDDDREPASPAPAARRAEPAARSTPPPREAPRRPAAVARPEPARPAPAGERVRASPLARKIADERGVRLAALTGSGPGGRIVERDVQAAVQGGKAQPAPESGAAPARPEPTPATAGTDRQVELSRIRRTTARRMAEAKRDVPHFYASADILMDEAVRLKASLVALGGEWTELTYTHLVLKAVGLALVRVPEVNASYEGETVRLHGAVNVGLATAVDDGLMVPVVRGCDREPLAALVRQVSALVERARRGRFASDDLTGGTFTVSNLGMFPVSTFAAVVNPPQAAILAVGAIREIPVVRDGAIVPGRVLTVTLSSDHRAIDGVLAGRFLRELKAILEQPLALIV